MAVRVFSKKDGETLQSVIEGSYGRDKALLNPKFSDFGEIETFKYGQNSFTGYKYRIEGAYSGNETCIDAYMEKGEYVYEIVIDINTLRNDKDTAISTILSSFDAQTLDFAETGTILFDIADAEGTYTESGNGFKVTMPMTYRKLASAGDDSMLFASDKNGAVVIVTGITKREVATLNPNEFLKTQQRSGSKLVKQPGSEKVGSRGFQTMVEYIKDEKESMASYRKLYLYTSNDTLIIVDAIINEIYYTDAALAEIDAIAESVVIGK